MTKAMNMSRNVAAARPQRGERREVNGQTQEFRIWGTSSGTRSGWMPVGPAAAPAAQAPAPAPAAAPPPPPPPVYTPTPLTISNSAPTTSTPTVTPTAALPAPDPTPPPPPPEYAPGGIGAALNNNAGGFRRKKSSSRESGSITKGTSQFKISKTQTPSSGLNIGV